MLLRKKVMAAAVARTLAAALAAALGMAAAPAALASSVSVSPIIELEAWELDAAGNKIAGWKAELTNGSTREWTFSSALGHWDDGATLNTDEWFAIDGATGAWSMTHDWNWSKAGNFDLTLDDANNTGNLDPFLTYGMSVKNNSGGLRTFQKTVTAPVSPGITGPNTVRASVSGGLTDATNDGVSITPAPNRPQDGDGVAELQLLLLNDTNANWNSATNAGVDVGLAQTFSGAPFSYTYGAYQDGFGPAVDGPSGAWHWMQVRTRFTLTGNGDTAAINGYAEITPVPEPSAYAMMLAGLGLVGGIAMRRRKQNDS